MPDAPRPQLFLFDGFALFLGRVSDTSSHAHYAAQLAVAIGEPLSLRTQDDWALHAAVLIPSNLRHELRAPPDGVVLLYVDPTSSVGQHLGRRYSDAAPADLDLEPFSEIRARARTFLQTGCDAARADGLRRELLEPLVPLAASQPSVDPRIVRALEHLDGEDAANWDVTALAREAALSPGRFRHLFRDQLGIPVRSYRLWARLRRAVALLTRGRTLTETAHTAGFADSAHLSRTFRRVFGIVPSDLLSARQAR